MINAQLQKLCKKTTTATLDVIPCSQSAFSVQPIVLHHRPTAPSRPYANPPKPPAKTDLVPSNNIARTDLYCNNTNSCNVVSSNKLISYYIRANNLDSALRVFHTMTDKTTVTWNSILAGFAKKRGKLIEAKKLFDEIPEPDIVSFNTMLACYLNNSGVDRAREFFDAMVVRDVASWNTLISGYAREGRMCEAYELFLAMPVKNAVSWNAIVSGYVEAGELDRAAEFFRLTPIKSVVAWTAMITGYMRKRNVEFAESLFREMPLKNLVSWNAMISGYVENGRGEDGLKFFKTMLELGVRPNASSLSSVLLGVSNLSALVLGKQVHQLVSKSPLYFDATSGTSLISMYCKCGDLEHAWKLFLEIPCKDVVTWNAMISGYAQHGAGVKALSLFDKMRGDGYQPDWITFVAVLSACNHAGLVDLGVQYFDTMRRDYGVEAKPDHYTCIVDLLGRCGRLSDAVDFIKKIPFKPHPAVFGTLLGACRIHKNTVLAEFAAENLISLEPASAAPYVQLANVYAAVNRWDHVARVRLLMKNSNVVKTPGYSWIEIKNVVHEFRSGDRIHAELACIHKKLHELEKKMRLAGYVPISEDALHNVDENQKGQLLLWHSEKLAIAFGLLRMPPETPIRVFKNLRVCGDCHLATKYISSIERREIIVRDTTRFHHFKDGICSCDEYW